MNNKSVDIIIPIYNAADDLKLCLQSIYNNTDLENNRLVLINDNSSDPRIKDILDSQNRKNVIVIHNKKNKGFSANINLGMEQSEENDVILLNSDTVVTAGWVEKMVACAYSSPEIGTVTPLSNNATLCSVPTFCAENKLPDNIDVEKMGKLVEHCSMKKYPRITVAHGFCMLIKREVINLIGNFDDATFGRGYGEENDFCNRAEQMGFIHVQCDDTFILHTGTKSFVSAEKEAYIREHDSILRKRYPSQMHANDVYVRDNPNGYIQENIRIFMDVENGRKNILYVMHTDFRKDASNNVGGTQMHVKQLKDNMIKYYNVFVAARDREYLNLTLYTQEKEHFWRFNIGEYNGYFRFHDRKLRNVWNLIFDAFNFSLIHIHHILGLSFDIFEIAKQDQIPVVLTCHDYYCITPSLILTDMDDHILSPTITSSEKWKETLNRMSGIYPKINYIDFWQRNYRRIMMYCDCIVVPNITVKNHIQEFYPELDDKIVVIDHGYNYNKQNNDDVVIENELERFYIERCIDTRFGYEISGWVVDDSGTMIDEVYLELNRNNDTWRVPASTTVRYDVKGLSLNVGTGFRAVIPYNKLTGITDVNLIMREAGILKRKTGVASLSKQNIMNGGLNIAFIGGISREKGGNIIYDLVQRKPEVNFYIFGNIGFEKLCLLETDNLLKFGQYNSDSLPLLMETYGIDVVCLLSVWPETFSYTLSESLLCGLPVIVTDIGALGDRVRKTGTGWTVDLDNAIVEISKILEGIEADKSELIEKKKQIKNFKHKSIETMANEYFDLYKKLNVSTVDKVRDFDAEKLYSSYCNRGYSIEKNDNRLVTNNNICSEDRDVLNSLSFKIAKKMRGIRFPFKRQVWTLLNRRVDQ